MSAAQADPVATGLTATRALRLSREAGAERAAMPPHLRGFPYRVSEIATLSLAIQGILGKAKRENRGRPDPQVQRLIAPMAETAEMGLQEKVVPGDLAGMAATIRGYMEMVRTAGRGGWADTEQAAWVERVPRGEIAVSLRVQREEMVVTVETVELVRLAMEASVALGATRGRKLDSAEMVDPGEWAAQAQAAKEVTGVSVETAASPPELAVVPV